MAKKTKWLDIPIYDLTLEEDDDKGVYMISLVDNPAMETLGVLLSTELVNPGKKETEDEFISRCISIEIKDGTAQDEKQGYAICKSKWDNRNLDSQLDNTKQDLSVRFSSVRDKKLIVCPVLIPEKLVYRNDIEGKGEGFIKFSADTIETALRKFNKSNNNTAINFMHQRNKVDGVILESWIIEDPNCDKAKVYGFDLPKGTWMSSIYIEDDKFWNDEVKGNELSSFSIEGDFSYKMVKLSEELTELELLNRAIDKMDPVDLLMLAEELAGPRYNRRANYRPNLHVNCQCNIVDGVWRLGNSESGPCQICINAQKKYNSRNK